MSANDPDFQAWTKTESDRYGWPKGPINAMELWNEPWEGIHLELPGSAAHARSGKTWQPLQKTVEIDVDLPAGEAHRLGLYFASVKVEALNTETGKVLDSQKVADTLDGKYLVYQAAGKMKLRLTSSNWLHASVAGIFFDPIMGATPKGVNSAQWQSTDEKTHGDWTNLYGKEGCLIAGAPEKRPVYAEVTLPEAMDKKDPHGPAGVPRYSYRKRPELPAG